MKVSELRIYLGTLPKEFDDRDIVVRDDNDYVYDISDIIQHHYLNNPDKNCIILQMI